MRQAAGVVLCGGASTRMGQPKAWLELDGETLLTRAVRTLGECVAPVIVCAAPGQVLPPVSRPVIRIDDEFPAGGPLVALSGALRQVETLRLPAAVTLGVDLPLFAAPMAELLLDSLRPGDAAVVPFFEGFPQPLAAVYRTEIIAVAQELIRAGSLSMRAFLDRIQYRALQPADYAQVDERGVMFQNVNTPEAFERLRLGGA